MKGWVFTGLDVTEITISTTEFNTDFRSSPKSKIKPLIDPNIDGKSIVSIMIHVLVFSGSLWQPRN